MGVHFAASKQCVSDHLEQMQLEGADAVPSVLVTFYFRLNWQSQQTYNRNVDNVMSAQSSSALPLMSLA